MKCKVKKSLAFLLAFVMVFTIVGVQLPVTVEAATKVALSCKTKRVAIGGTYTLTVKGVNDKKATYAWSSSDKKVATVSKNGVITGESEGTAKIECKITMSDKSTKTLSCKVTVLEQTKATSVKIRNAKLDENNAHTLVVGESYDFNRKLSPSKSNDKTYWYIQDEEYAEVDSQGVVTAKKAGTTTLIAKTGIDRVSAEESTNKVIDSVCLNIVPGEISVGDSVTFGKYKQGNSVDDIEWIVLEVQDTQALLLSKYCFEKRIHTVGEAVSGWKHSQIREYLNEDFYESAFSKEEQALIKTTELINQEFEENVYADDVYADDYDNPNTQDKVFLLSAAELKTYFNSDEQRMAGTVDEPNSATSYWLRLCVEAAFGWRNGPWIEIVTGFGEISEEQSWAADITAFEERELSVRPAVWVSLENGVINIHR